MIPSGVERASSGRMGGPSQIATAGANPTTEAGTLHRPRPVKPAAPTIASDTIPAAPDPCPVVTS